MDVAKWLIDCDNGYLFYEFTCTLLFENPNLLECYTIRYIRVFCVIKVVKETKHHLKWQPTDNKGGR